jgi:drug/metabolite transporter (DMT)-like permease
MIWLALSVCAALALALIARWGEGARQDRIVMMAWNYAMASAVTGGMAWAAGIVMPDAFTLGVGAVTGLSYAAALLFWMVAIPLAGLGVSTTAMRLSVVWPALAAMLFYGEIPLPLQGVGIGFALASVGLLLLSGGGLSTRLARRSVLWLVALWASSGLNAVLLKVFTAGGDPAQRPMFLALIFIVAGVVCWAIVAWRALRSGGIGGLRSGDLLRGSLFGFANVWANVFLLRALQEIPAVVVFPVRDAGIIATVSLAGVLLLRERPSRWGYAAIAAAVLAVVFMSL